MAWSVLVVDDDIGICRVLGRELTGRGYRVLIAHDRDDALRQLAENRARQQPIDILLTDLRLDEASGLSLLRDVVRVSPTTRSVMMSGYATANDHEVARNLGAVAVLWKPFTNDQLAAALEKAIECQATFHGDLHGLTLMDLLQLFHRSRRSITIRVTGPREGEIHLHDGNVVHAVAGERRGEPALRDLLRSPSGFLRTSPPTVAPCTVHRPLTNILLDHLRELDQGPPKGKTVGS